MSTTTSAFPVKPLQRPTPPKIGAKKGAYDGGYNKGLWTTRVTFQKGDLNPWSGCEPVGALNFSNVFGDKMVLQMEPARAAVYGYVAGMGCIRWCVQKGTLGTVSCLGSFACPHVPGPGSDVVPTSQAPIRLPSR